MMRLMVFSILGATGFVAPAMAACPDEPTRYEISRPAVDRAQVEISLTLASDWLSIANFQTKDGAMATHEFIENVVATGNGRSAALTHAGGGAWPVDPLVAGDKVTVSYDLKLRHGEYKWPFGAEEIGGVFEDNVYLVSRVGMLADYGAPDCPIDVVFQTKDASAPWPKTGPLSYRAQSLSAFHANGFAFGDAIGRFTANTAQGAVTFVHDAASTELAQQAARDTAKMTGHLAKIFGGFPASNFHIFLFANDHPEGGAFDSSFAMLHPSPIEPVDALIWRHGFIHEIIHLWLGHSISPAQGADIEWFKEGFTDYLAIKTLWRMGFIDEDELTQKLEMLLRRHTLGMFMSQGGVKLSEAGANKSQNLFIIYGGGGALAMMLDMEMSAKQRPGAFEDMLAALYADSEKPYTNERLLQKLDAASNGAASRLLATFDQGLTPMDMAPIIESYDVDMAFMIPDLFELDINPEKCRRKSCYPAFLQVRRRK